MLDKKVARLAATVGEGGELVRVGALQHSIAALPQQAERALLLRLLLAHLSAAGDRGAVLELPLLGLLLQARGQPRLAVVWVARPLLPKEP